jgi:hypothetical protein
MIKVLTIILGLTFLLFNCSSGDKAPELKDKVENPKSDISKKAESETMQSKTVKLKSAKLVKVMSGNPAKIELEFTGDQDNSSVDDYDIEYSWYVNATLVMETAENELAPDYFFAGDILECKVNVYDSQENLVTKISSRQIQVPGLPPNLDPEPVRVPEVPGLFEYRINATRNELNYDRVPEDRTLVFSLLSPIGKGIVFDNKTGEISWDLTPEIVERFKNRVEIKFKVTNEFNASVTSSIILNFSSVMREKKK